MAQMNRNNICGNLCTSVDCVKTPDLISVALSVRVIRVQSDRLAKVRDGPVGVIFVEIRKAPPKATLIKANRTTEGAEVTRKGILFRVVSAFSVVLIRGLCL
jgi:hypothetical protein